MVNQKIVSYIRKGLKDGYSIQELKTALVKEGWSPADIREAVSFVRGSQLPARPMRKTSPAHLGLGGKIGKVLAHPSEFFPAVKTEQGVGDAFKYYAVISLIPTIIIAVAMLAFASLFSLGDLLLPGMEMFGLFFAGIGIAVVVGGYVMGLVGTFISAAILHLFALIGGVKNGYSNTYKVSVYASTPSVLLLWLTFFLMFLVGPVGMIVTIALAIWGLYLIIKGLSVLHGVSMKRALGIVLIPVVIVLLLVTAGMLMFLLSVPLV